MKSIITIIAAMVLIWFHFDSVAQNQLPELENYFNDVRKGKSVSFPDELFAKTSIVFEGLVVYQRDSISSIRSKAYSITQQIGLRSNDPSIRQTAILQLISACKDPYSGNVGLVLDYLSSFKTQDFTQEAKDNIKALTKPNQPHLDKVLKLIGFLQITDQVAAIRPYTQPGNNQRIRWAAIVSLARMGDESAVQDMMTRAKKLKVNDAAVEEIFPGLLYSRQRQALDYMVEVLRSENKNCTSTGENTAPIVCGYRIMEQLAKAVKDYPLTLDASGDIKTKDYKAALATVRTWFNEHKNYEIDNDIF